MNVADSASSLYPAERRGAVAPVRVLHVLRLLLP
jgi:hypothetical protein